MKNHEIAIVNGMLYIKTVFEIALLRLSDDVINGGLKFVNNISFIHSSVTFIIVL